MGKNNGKGAANLRRINTQRKYDKKINKLHEKIMATGVPNVNFEKFEQITINPGCEVCHNNSMIILIKKNHQMWLRCSNCRMDQGLFEFKDLN